MNGIPDSMYSEASKMRWPSDRPTREKPMSNIELLGRYGDPMERAIVRQSMTELGGILAPYADIWRAYVKPARIGTGEILNPECMLFGGNHYTALIRAHNALGFYK